MSLMNRNHVNISIERDSDVLMFNQFFVDLKI